MSKIEIKETHYLEAKFRATFQNAVSRLRNNKTLISETFFVRDIPWNIRLGLNSVNGSTVCYYLDCLKSGSMGLKAKPEFSIKMSYKFSIIRTSGQPIEQNSTTTFTTNVRSGRIVGITLSELSRPSEGYTYDDALTIHVELKEEFPPTFIHWDPKKELIQSLQPTATNDLVKDLGALLNSGDGDIAFKLKDGAIIKAHKIILCARNAIFATMLSVDMKEAKTMEVRINDMGEGVLKILLLHIYTGQLSLPEEFDIYSCKELVYAAEKYNLPELKEVAGMAVAGFCSATNALQLFTFCRYWNLTRATKTLATYVKENTDSVLGELEFCG